MRAAWHALEFRVLDFKDTGTFILGGIDDVQACALSAAGKQGALVITLKHLGSNNLAGFVLFRRC